MRVTTPRGFQSHDPLFLRSSLPRRTDASPSLAASRIPQDSVANPLVFPHWKHFRGVQIRGTQHRRGTGSCWVCRAIPMGIETERLTANRRGGVDAPPRAVRTRRTRSGAPDTRSSAEIREYFVWFRVCSLLRMVTPGMDPVRYHSGNDTALRASPFRITTVSLPGNGCVRRAVTTKGVCPRVLRCCRALFTGIDQRSVSSFRCL